jgi:hypothetical protein
MTGAIRELSVALVKGNEVMYREALHVFATAGGTAARAGATLSSFVFAVVCCVVVPDACHCLYGVDHWLSELCGLLILTCLPWSYHSGGAPWLPLLNPS